MPKRKDTSGGELFIIDNSDKEWKVLRYLRDWAEISKKFSVAIAFLEVGALLALDSQWQKQDRLRISMGPDFPCRTKETLLAGIERIRRKLDDTIERRL